MRKNMKKVDFVIVKGHKKNKFQNLKYLLYDYCIYYVRNMPMSLWAHEISVSMLLSIVSAVLLSRGAAGMEMHIEGRSYLI